MIHPQNGVGAPEDKVQDEREEGGDVRIGRPGQGTVTARGRTTTVVTAGGGTMTLVAVPMGMITLARAIAGRGSGKRMSKGKACQNGAEADQDEVEDEGQEGGEVQLRKKVV